jgi:hypothetical protein
MVPCSRGHSQDPECFTLWRNKGRRVSDGFLCDRKISETNAQYQRFLDDPNGFSSIACWEYSPEAIQRYKDHRKSKARMPEVFSFPPSRNGNMPRWLTRIGNIPGETNWMKNLVIMEGQ